MINKKTIEKLAKKYNVNQVIYIDDKELWEVDGIIHFLKEYENIEDLFKNAKNFDIYLYKKNFKRGFKIKPNLFCEI